MIGLLPLFPSNVYHFILEEDTNELDPRGFEFLKHGGNTFASSTKNIRVLEEYPKTVSYTHLTLPTIYSV